MDQFTFILLIVRCILRGIHAGISFLGNVRPLYLQICLLSSFSSSSNKTKSLMFMPAPTFCTRNACCLQLSAKRLGVGDTSCSRGQPHLIKNFQNVWETSLWMVQMFYQNQSTLHSLLTVPAKPVTVLMEVQILEPPSLSVPLLPSQSYLIFTGHLFYDEYCSEHFSSSNWSCEGEDY